MLGTGAVTVRVSVMTCEAAPEADTVTVPLYVPAARFHGFTETANDEGAIPEAGDTASHGALELAVQPSVPPPALETVTVCDGGTGPPISKEKLNWFRERAIAGPVVIVKRTGISKGLLTALADAIRTVPE
jgi:hypothetical protein